MTNRVADRGLRIVVPRHKEGHVFVISGPSGGGKTTVTARLLRALPRLTRSVSVTTRTMRRSERQGRDYYFVSPAAFQRLRRAGQLLEWARVHDAYYGTPKQPVLQALAKGRDVVLSIDVQGARQVRRALGRRAALIFLLPPSMDHLRRRLVGRKTETPAAIRRRLAAAQRELSCAAWYDYTVINDRLTRAIQDIRAIVNAHGRVVDPPSGGGAPQGGGRSVWTTQGVAAHGTGADRRAPETVREHLPARHLGL
ncbi:MAG: guanylate kinase [Candidatus Omnitrophica bacterium]|nr:guanylate kinase [Candidatus Omnitrophota bacterium]